MIFLWHVHSITGNCYAVTVDYETAIRLCMQFYDESQHGIVFFATRNANAGLNTEALPNS